MADVAIRRKPDTYVSGLSAPTRPSNGNRELTIKWKVSNWAKDGKNDRRIEGFDVTYIFYCYNISTKKSKTLKYERTTGNKNTTEWTLNLYSFKCSDGKTYNRNKDFFPASGSWCITSVTAMVRARNSKGRAAWVKANRKFELPRQPTIVSVTHDDRTGEVTVKVKHNKGNDYRENWRTRVLVDVWDSRTRSWPSVYKKEFMLDTNTDNRTVKVSDVYARMNLTYDQYFEVRVRAWSEGIRGRSDNGDSKKTVMTKLFVSWPQKPVIIPLNSKDKPQGQQRKFIVGNREDITNKVTFGLETGYHPTKEYEPNGRNHHPCTGVKLQKLVNVDYDRPIDIPASAEDDWKDCGAMDNGQCDALSSTVAELQPERGKHTFVRVKAWNNTEEIFYRFSDIERMYELERPVISATGATLVITKAEPGADGRSAVVSVAWNDPSTPDMQFSGVEFSWSEYENAWRSTDEPDTYRVTWDDGAVTHEQTDYAHSATLYIAGLSEGTAYHIRARHYHVDSEDNETFGEYCIADETVTPVTSPTSVVLSAPQFVRRGTSIPLSWTFDSEAEQTSWQLITGETVDVTAPDGNTYKRIDESSAGSGATVTAKKVTVIASGTDAMGSCVIPWDQRIDDMDLSEVIGPDDTLPLAVRVSTGGEFVTSDAALVRVDDPPTLVVDAPDVTAQPITINLAASDPVTVSVVVSSQYVAGASASVTSSGVSIQPEGDTVWSTLYTPTSTLGDGDEVVAPDWVLDPQDNMYHATLTSEGTLDLRNGGNYLVTARATNVVTGLSSDYATDTFAVDYARLAPTPSDDITVTPYDTTDDTGARARGCTIELAAGEGSVESDVYDLYRVTADGVQLCASGVPLDAEVDDPYAPFGDGAELAYRVSCRTTDGDESWRDYPYELAGHDMRIDFDDAYGPTYVELPYNLSFSDSYEKDFEARRHLDGSVDGYWNRGAKRTAGLKTDLIKIRDEAKARAVRQLGRSAGAAYVRLGDGSAYQADVQVNGLDREVTSAALAVSLNVTEVGLTSDYMATVVVEEQQDEPEQSGS